jgi:hypothetical protein
MSEDLAKLALQARQQLQQALADTATALATSAATLQLCSEALHEAVQRENQATTGLHRRPGKSSPAGRCCELRGIFRGDARKAPTGAIGQTRPKQVGRPTHPKLKQTADQPFTARARWREIRSQVIGGEFSVIREGPRKRR